MASAGARGEMPGGEVAPRPPGRHGRGRGANPRPCHGHRSLPSQLAPAETRARPTGHGDCFSLARCTMAWARRTYLLSARSRTLLTPSAWAKASAAPLDRPSAVTGASARPANLSTSDWSSGGGWLSGCSTILPPAVDSARRPGRAVRCSLDWRCQPVVVGGPPCPWPPGPVLAGGAGAAGGALGG